MVRIILSNTYFRKQVESASLMSVVPPLDLSYCAAVLRESGIGKRGLQVTLIDANALGLDFDDHRDMIVSSEPEILVLTAKTNSINAAGRLCREIKRQNKLVKTVLVGPHGTALPRQTMEEIPQLDFIILGEPERTIVEIAGGIIGNKDINTIQNIAYRKGSGVQVNQKQAFIRDLDSLPFPARDLLPNSRYWSPFSGRVTAIEATRGCPGRCSYCEMHNLYGFSIRKRDPERIADEIEDCVKRYGTEYFAFVDHNFTADASFVERFCSIIIERGLGEKISWSCNSRVDMIERKTLDLMRQAGCLLVGTGIEAGDEKHLEAMRKGISQEQIRDTVRNIKEAGLFAMGYSMIGYPGDTIKDVELTEKLLSDYNPHMIQVSMATPLPGSELYDRCKKEGLIASSDWDDFSFLKKSVIKNTKLPPWKLEKERKRMISGFYLRPKKLLELTRLMLFNPKVRYNNVVRAFFRILFYS